MPGFLSLSCWELKAWEAGDFSEVDEEALTAETEPRYSELA
jgi:hypothetical protein